MKGPIEETRRYATTVEELPEAWAFVMARVDSVGESPYICIQPVMVCEHEGEEHHYQRHFDVVVAGTTETPQAAENS